MRRFLVACLVATSAAGLAWADEAGAESETKSEDEEDLTPF